jgi:hypothetical protein
LVDHLFPFERAQLSPVTQFWIESATVEKRLDGIPIIYGGLFRPLEPGPYTRKDLLAPRSQFSVLVPLGPQVFESLRGSLHFSPLFS